MCISEKELSGFTYPLTIIYEEHSWHTHPVYASAVYLRMLFIWGKCISILLTGKSVFLYIACRWTWNLMHLIHVKMTRTLRYSIYKHIYHINVDSCAPLRANNVKVKFCQFAILGFWKYASSAKILFNNQFI